MAERLDMTWDHVGEDLDTDSPLLESHRESSVYRNVDDVHLSYTQTQQLVTTLEETNEIIKSYLAEVDLEKGLEFDRRSNKRTPNLCRKCSELLNKITGTKAVVFTILLQGLNVLIQTFMDIWAKKDDDIILVVSGLTMIFLQVVNLVLIVVKSAQIAKQLLDRKVSGIMLAQTYFASILLFSGIYTVTKRIKPDSWKYLREDIADDPVLIIILYCRFLYFSVSTATLCGSSAVLPNDWYNYIFVSIQMLLSFMYFASILGQAISPLSQLKPEPAAEKRLPSMSTRNSPTSLRLAVGSRNSISSLRLTGGYGTITNS